MSVEDEIDALYSVAPDGFTALRLELAAAAKKRGDSDGAKLIGAARRPTTAAWVANALVRRDPSARPRLAELTESLRAAHAAMDGPRIRALTRTQRTLIDSLVTAGLAAAGCADASAALRTDVTDTLQAAVADPGVAARLGRLVKAERWSGFGDFGETVLVATTPESELTAANERLSIAASEADAAVAAQSDAIGAVSGRKAKLAVARRRYEKLAVSFGAAEQVLHAADEQFAAAERAANEAASRFGAATSELELAESELAALIAKHSVS